MSKGKVKFYNETKGFGFIAEDGTGTEYFVHATGLVDNAAGLREGETVEFDLEEGRRGLNAVNVAIVEDDGAEAPSED